MTTAVIEDDAFVMPSFIGSFVTHVALLIATAAAVAPLRVTVDDPPRDGIEQPDKPVGWSTSEELSRVALAEAAEFRMGGLPGASYEGAMGDPEGPPRAGRFGVLGPVDNPDPHIANARWTDDACWDCIGVHRVFNGDRHAPIAPWGSQDSLGNDSESARGLFSGDSIGAAAGRSGGSRGDGGQTGYGDGAGGPLPSYVHRCRLE